MVTGATARRTGQPRQAQTNYTLISIAWRMPHISLFIPRYGHPPEHLPTLWGMQTTLFMIPPPAFMNRPFQAAF
jgi:hypothetical protein